MSRNIFTIATAFSFSVGLFFITTPPAAAQSNTPNQSTWIANGTVNAIMTTGTTAYIGGGFQYVGPNTGQGVAVSRTTGMAIAAYPRFNNTVRVSLSDGQGGFYLGGDFTKVDGLDIKRLAHVRADGTLDTTFSFNPNNSIHTLAWSPDRTKLYVGGAFTLIGVMGRNRLAAIDVGTQTVTSWDPSSNGIVYALATSGTTIYAGGGFSLMGSSFCSNMIALDAVTATATNWFPALNDVVTAIALNPATSTVYIGGTFTTVGGDPRPYVAGLNPVSGSSTAWTPNPDNVVTSLIFSPGGSTLYVGGQFANIGGQARVGIAELNMSTGTATAWNANADSTINVMAVTGTTVYVGGNFSSIGGQNRNYLAALSTATASSTSWDPNPDNGINALALGSDNQNIFVGGQLVSLNGVYRNFLAAIDLTTGQATAWNPNADNPVNALAMSPDGSKIYAGGNFNNVGGQVRNYLAALSPTTGLATAWDPNLDNFCNALTVSNDGQTVYAGGNLQNVGGSLRSRVAAIDATTGLATAWHPTNSYPVHSMVLNPDNSKLYLGTGLTTCRGGFPPRCSYTGEVTAFLTSDGTQVFSQIADEHVYGIALAPDEKTLYAGGNFTSLGIEVRTRLGAIDLTSPTYDVSSWDPVANDMVRALVMDPDGRQVYILGNFSTIAGATRTGATALDVSTGQANAWNPNAPNGVYVMSLANNATQTLIGGDFIEVGGLFRYSFARFDSPNVQFSGSASSFLENAGTVNIPVTLSATDTSDVVVEYTITGGSATANVDFTPSSGSTVIPAGSLTGNIQVTLVNDDANEAAETLTINLSRAYHATPTGQLTHALTILNDDTGGGALSVPAGAYSPPQASLLGLKINSGAATTDARLVNLTFTAGPEVTRLAVSNFSDFLNASLENYQAGKSWDLCTAATCLGGPHTVYAKFYNAYGYSSGAVSANINYQSPTGSQSTNGQAGNGTIISNGKILVFKRDLRVGDTNSDVKLLQRFLNAQGFAVAKSGPGSPGKETTKFGAATRAAVKKYQEAHRAQILTPQGLKQGNGVLGPSTRKFINGLKVNL